MIALLKFLHVLGWSGWFGLAVAEAVAGAQARKAEPAGQAALARAWGRLGRLQLILMGVGVVFGLATFLYEGLGMGLGTFMRQRAFLYLHLMLGLGLLAGLLALLAGRFRSVAVAAAEQGDAAAFTSAYKRASMFSGMVTLLLLLTIAEVYLRSLL